MTRQPLRDFRADRADVWLFLVCLIVGGAGIVVLKFFADVDQLKVTLFPALVLILYAFYVGRTKRYQLRGDRAGDSVYYLGFLYTLVSLGISLAQFVTAGLQPREIVANLGIALLTTIIGLAARVILTQLREDPVEIEESARMALAEAASQVRSELAQMVEDVNVFRRITMQSVTEGAEEVSRETNRALSENVVAFTSSARAVVDRIEEVFAEFGGNAKRLNKVSAGTVTALEKLIARVEAVEAPQTLISSKFDPLAERMGAALAVFTARADEQAKEIERLRRLAEQTTGAATLSMERMSALAAAVEKAQGGVADQTREMAERSESIKSLAEAVKLALGEASERQAASVRLVGQAGEEAVAAVRRSVSELMEWMSALAAAVEKAQGGVADQTREMAERSESIKSLAEAVKLALHETSERQATSARLVGQAGQEAVAAVRRSVAELAAADTAALGRMSDTLTETARTVAGALRALEAAAEAVSVAAAKLDSGTMMLPEPVAE